MALFRDERFIKIFLQLVFVAVFFTGLILLVQSVASALAANNLTPTFAFLDERAGFAIAGAETYYSPDDSYWRAYVVGLENTLRVIVVGLPVTTILGIIVGIMLLSSNFLVRSIAQFVVEVLRNTPLLVQLFAFYYIVILALPPVQNSIEIPEGNPLLVLNNRGIVFPELIMTPRFALFAVIALVGVAIGAAFWSESGKIIERTGRVIPRVRGTLAIVIGVGILGYVVASLPPPPTTITVVRDGGTMEVAVSESLEENILTPEERASVARTPLTILYPQRAGLRYQNGNPYTATYIALTVSLIIYTAAFVAEIVRAGIMAVDRGQIEASRALGLSFERTLSLVILPQALRVIIPPLGNQYLNLAKNSSLAIAIAFADLFQVSTTIINQRNQTVSVFAMVMVTYLIISLSIAYVMNWINGRFELVTRDTVIKRPLWRRLGDWVNYTVLRRPHVER
ncbi:MAG: ABC transporter permease subunit [Anaerolineae bacterium]|nr:ABC transporter permease subunit [Anaerolineae bacterium]